MLTKQYIFNTVSRHLLSQGQRCATHDYDGGELCRYKHDTLSCAIGCLLPDDFDTKDIEGASARALPEEIYFVMGLDKDDETVKFLERLQECHDERDPRDWFDALRDIAGRYQLRTTSLTAE